MCEDMTSCTDLACRHVVDTPFILVSQTRYTATIGEKYTGEMGEGENF